MPERAYTPPGYTDKGRSKSRHHLLNARTSWGTFTCAPIRPQINKPNQKVPMPRPVRPAAPPRQMPRRAAFGREWIRRSASEIYRRPGRVPSPPRFSPSFVIGWATLVVLFIISASGPTAVARPLHKGRGGGGATGRRPYHPPSPLQGQNQNSQCIT